MILRKSLNAFVPEIIIKVFHITCPVQRFTMLLSWNSAKRSDVMLPVDKLWVTAVLFMAILSF